MTSPRTLLWPLLMAVVLLALGASSTTPSTFLAWTIPPCAAAVAGDDTEPAQPGAPVSILPTDGSAGFGATDHLAATPLPDWQVWLRHTLSNPNVAYVLLLIGFYGVVYELANPGTVLPGILGAVCLVLALYAFQLLPVHWAGLALIGLGLGLMIAEAFAPSLGALGLSGTAIFVIGSLTLIGSDAPGQRISMPLIGGLALSSALLLFFVVRLGLRARRRPVVSGWEELIGAAGTAVSGFPGAGSVHLHGEVWSARCPQPIPPGQPVRVQGRDGLTLLVEPLSQSKE